MVSVYRFGQDRSTPPVCVIDRKTADTWWAQGAGESHGRGTQFVLAKAVTDQLQLRSPMGASLTWAYLHRVEEAIAAVYSHAFGANPVEVADRLLAQSTR